MTNQEALIQALKDEFDDVEISEAWIYSHIECPYSLGNIRTNCHNNVKNCYNCKRKWLDSEVKE